MAVTLKCEKCQTEFSNDYGHTGIHFVEGATALEQIRDGRVVYLCPECAKTLRRWLST
jgi:DNA-directed RNA polymerase subunit RPC12/RpoP